MDTETTLPLARRLDLIVLRPDTTRSDVERLCSAARGVGCQAVCVPGSWVSAVAGELEGSGVKVSALISFPFGTADPDVKRYEVEAAVDAGAQELEVVIHPGWIKSGEDARILRELRDVREAADERPVKAILERGMLSAMEAERMARLVVEAELQFLVTATGCAGRAISPEDLAALRAAVGPELGLKAVGGVLTPVEAQALVAAGANRLGVFDLGPFTVQP